MSGTSLDAIDIVHLHLVRKESWSFHILHMKSVEYPEFWTNRLTRGIDLSNSDLKSLDEDYTIYLASTIKAFIFNNNIQDLLAICSHGHTIHHRPDIGETLQIGNLPQIAQHIDLPVICDFRTQDVMLGGQGAPLVPIGDKLLYSNYNACLNLGGFANVSSEKNHNRVAYDICPVNVVLNKYALMLGREYDDGGAFAKAGKVNSLILKELNKLVYYKLSPPKSLGMEWVNENIWSLLQSLKNPKDALATFTEHIAIQIASNLSVNSTVLITGGGAYNSFLINRIRLHSSADLIVPDPNIVEYKEAIIFALLGVLRLRNENNILSSVTGASKDHCSGRIYLP